MVSRKDSTSAAFPMNSFGGLKDGLPPEEVEIVVGTGAVGGSKLEMVGNRLQGGVVS